MHVGANWSSTHRSVLRPEAPAPVMDFQNRPH
jgi:hypothetical protein